MKNLLSLVFSIILLSPIVGFSQELPSNYELKRGTGDETGLPYFQLTPSLDSIVYDAERGNTFEALGAQIQPERNIYGLLFMNAKTKFQMATSKNRKCGIKINDENFPDKSYSLFSNKTVGRLKIEFVLIKIDKELYEKLIEADDVTVKCATVSYNLDQDNIDAIRYLASEIEKDLTRRGKSAK